MQDLELRTKDFSLDVIRFVRKLPNGQVERAVSPQLLKSATSIGANYGEAGRAQSDRDFLHKIALVEKEAAEAQFWLELTYEASLGDRKAVQHLLQESDGLLSFFDAIARNMRKRVSESKAKK
jgi:four helix bundle protein